MGPELTPQMIVVLLILALTIYLFVSEKLRVDVTAIVIMVILGLFNLFSPVRMEGESIPWLMYYFPSLAESAPWLNQALQPVVSGDDLFRGFASNAVISIIAVMIIGAGLDRTGLMTSVANTILKIGGTTEKRIIPLISSTVGVISSFMQNVGAAALFLPVVSRISARTGLPLSRLLMPMGFCAILGGTITMVGSSPLILLNDLINNSNNALPEGQAPMATFELFDVTPIGLALVITGILYFVLAGRYVLPSRGADTDLSQTGGPGRTLDYFRDIYGIEGDISEVRVGLDSVLVGMTVQQADDLDAGVAIVALAHGEDFLLAPAREEMIWVGSRLALMGDREVIADYIERNKLQSVTQNQILASRLSPAVAGISEIVVPPSSNMIGKTARDIGMARHYGLNVLAIHRGEETHRADRRDIPLLAGDTLVIHSRWRDLHRVAQQHQDFVVITDYPHEDTRPHKVPYAVGFFLLALSLILFTELKLSIALLAGAVGMILSGVLRIDEAYQSVDWKTVFLLASLIPLGQAVDSSGTAAWIATQTLNILEGVPVWTLQAAVAVLATLFTLVMSNVGATVLLVPLAVNIAVGAGADPRVFALTVAIATSNSFLIPTHQVNALIMGPAGYRVPDFMRAGGIMTVLFLIVSLVMLNVVF